MYNYYSSVAARNRVCNECGKTIIKGTTHMAYDVIRLGHTTRKNICPACISTCLNRCAGEIIKVLQDTFNLPHIPPPSIISPL